MLCCVGGVDGDSVGVGVGVGDDVGGGVGVADDIGGGVDGVVVLWLPVFVLVLVL